MGVIDGHDVKALRRALRQALNANRPVVVHIKTVKGKGFAPAEEGGLEGMEKWHAAKPKSIANGRVAATKKPAAKAPASPPQYTEVFGRALVEEARRDPRVIGITAAMAGGTGLSMLADEVPEQYYDVGIAEQHAVLFAAGLALEGMKPVAAIYSTFLQRGFDQIVHDVCLQKLDVTFCMDRAGLVGDDGPTHHGSYDISYLRAASEHRPDGAARRGELVHMLRTAIVRRRAGRDPVSARGGGGSADARPRRRSPRSAPARPLAQGERVALVGYGTGVQIALDAAAVLRERGLDPTVCDARFAKPLDRELLHSLAASARTARDSRGERARRRVRVGGAGAAIRLGDALGRTGCDPLRPPGPLRHPRQA